MGGGGRGAWKETYFRNKTDLKKKSARQNIFQFCSHLTERPPVLCTRDGLQYTLVLLSLGTYSMLKDTCSVALLFLMLLIFHMWSFPPPSHGLCLLSIHSLGEVPLSPDPWASGPALAFDPMETFVDCNQKTWVCGTTQPLSVSVGESHCFLRSLCLLICDEGMVIGTLFTSAHFALCVSVYYNYWSSL